MFFPEQQVRVFLYGAPVDMRRSFDGLYAIARHGMQADPLAGHLFAFLNRRATQIKILYFDRSGWCVWVKQLEQGRFLSDWKRVVTREIDVTQLKLLLEGIEVVRRRHRYRHAARTSTAQESP
ncbi:MAG TPA: IS66 family insertion sequence element accessory protein TnpB [Burkholderiaceae bacterium]|nr:IS66 family insertion sequence element accessory protein TnpB [Burkholderiaceae bacterium]